MDKEPEVAIIKSLTSIITPTTLIAVANPRMIVFCIKVGLCPRNNIKKVSRSKRTGYVNEIIQFDSSSPSGRGDYRVPLSKQIVYS